MSKFISTGKLCIWYWFKIYHLKSRGRQRKAIESLGYYTAACIFNYYWEKKNQLLCLDATVWSYAHSAKTHTHTQTHTRHFHTMCCCIALYCILLLGTSQSRNESAHQRESFGFLLSVFKLVYLLYAHWKLYRNGYKHAPMVNIHIVAVRCFSVLLLIAIITIHILAGFFSEGCVSIR